MLRIREIIILLVKQVPILIEQSRVEITTNSQYCKLCVADAFEGRLSSGLAANKTRGKFIFTIFQIQTSEILLNLILFCSMAHSLSVFMEPIPASETLFGTRLLHVFCILVYILDILLKIGYQGIDDYFESEWQVLYAGSAALNLVDLILHGGRTSW